MREIFRKANRDVSGEPRVVAVVQARTSSSRLPAKVLLPVGGVPLALLAVARVARDGLEARLATSEHPSDDELARLAAREGIPVHRGSLADPLGRFVEATRDLSDRDVIVRLTADNAFPDAALVRELIEALRGRGLRYVRASTESGLPFGVSAEAFELGALRAADRDARGAYEREHVTPAVRRLFGDATLERAGGGRCAHLRATVDTYADYLRVARAFAGAGDPVAASFEELTRALAELPNAPAALLPRAPRAPGLATLVLGTAQLGQPYGVANEAGMPSEEEAAEIVELAIAHGVTHVDTARAYGGSEARLGSVLAKGDPRALSVITKLRPLHDVTERTPREWALEAERSLLESLVALRRDSVGVLLVHREGDVRLGGGAVLERLLELRDRGLVAELGASVQNPEEALRALEVTGLTHLQLPMNLLDGRWAEVARRRGSRPDVTIVARSALLQGLLSGRVPAARFPSNAGLDPRALASALDSLVADLGRESWVDLALAFVRGEPWIDAVVLGVERAPQLREAAHLFGLPPLDDEGRREVRARLPACATELLDPSRWRFDASESGGDR